MPARDPKSKARKRCVVCKKMFWVYKKKLERKVRPTAGKYCSRECHLKDIRKQALSHSKHYYFSKKINGKSVPYHRFLVEQTLGRKLPKDLVVHHLNGNTRDNRLDNLQIMDRREHHRYHTQQLWAAGTYNFLAEAHKGKKNPRWKGGKTKFFCEECGHPYWKHPDKRFGTHFCSKACQFSSKKWKKRIGEGNTGNNKSKREEVKL